LTIAASVAMRRSRPVVAVMPSKAVNGIDRPSGLRVAGIMVTITVGVDRHGLHGHRQAFALWPDTVVTAMIDAAIGAESRMTCSAVSSNVRGLPGHVGCHAGLRCPQARKIGVNLGPADRVLSFRHP